MFLAYDLTLLSRSSIQQFRDVHTQCDELLKLKS